ncbi:hypothetical protein [Niastella populi]|uniref:hypothetical protein n=1 Tax=Niastella populi TaxID=550983 RepID=UPI001055B978|nr:hypothetical protein [Niastella populi]
MPQANTAASHKRNTGESIKTNATSKYSCEPQSKTGQQYKTFTNHSPLTIHQSLTIDHSPIIDHSPLTIDHSRKKNAATFVGREL